MFDTNCVCLDTARRMNTLIEGIEILRQKTDVYDYVMEREDKVINSFLFGTLNNDFRRNALEVHEKLLDTLVKIIYSDDDYKWHSAVGIYKDRSLEILESQIVYFDEDIKDLIDHIEKHV